MAGTLYFPLDCFVGLAVAGTEVGVTGYVRQPVTLAYCEDGVTIANTASLQWQHAMYTWGVIDTVQLWVALSAGPLLGSLTPLAPIEIRQYDIARIPASGLAVTYDTISRPYGTGSHGTYGYGTSPLFTTVTVVLERAFEQQQNLCSPGTWAPGPFALAA
jgi:hypothetical protein